MNGKRIGRRTVALRTPPSVLSFANIGGRMEGQGPLAKYFDELCEDSFFGEKTWEKAESAMQERVLRRALEQAGLPAQVLRTPRALQEQGCGYCVRAPAEPETIRQLLTDERIAFRRLYRRGADGAWQEAEP